MIAMKLAYVKAPCSRQYTANTTGILPQRMALLEPEAAAAFKTMLAACSRLMTFTDVYRSVQYQIECIHGASPLKRGLYAPPTKSGHNFGMSVDVDIDETVEHFAKSGNPDLAKVTNRDQLAAWMTQFGWKGISTERWHFDFRKEFGLVVDRIDSLYGKSFVLQGSDLQHALNVFLPDAKLSEDGVVGARTLAAVSRARGLLNIDTGSGPDAWFQRVLAGATAQVEVI